MFFIQEIFAQDREISMNLSKRKSGQSISLESDFDKPIICEKLWAESIKDKLDAQPDIFCNDPRYFRESPNLCRERMEDIIQWVCKNLLFDEFEFVFWLNIIEKDQFDIINVRSNTAMGSQLKLEWLLLYIGLHLKSYLNYKNSTTSKSKSKKKAVLDDGSFLNVMNKNMSSQ